MKKIQLDYGGDNQITVQDSDSVIDFLVGDSDITGLDSPMRRVVSLSRPGQDGSTIPSNFFGGRLISWQQVIAGDTAAEHITNRKNLFKALLLSRDSNGVAQTKVARFTDNDDSVYRVNYVARKVQFPRNKITLDRGVIILECEDEALLSDTLSTETITLASGGGFTIPFTIPFTISPQVGGSTTLVNDGDLPAWPTIIFRGPLTSPTILNETSGVFLQLSGLSLEVGESVTITMRPLIITQDSINDKFSTKTSSSSPWSLAPGSNVIVFTDTVFDSRASVSISWRDSYSGI